MTEDRIQLIPTRTDDLHTLHRFQLDEDARYGAAFMPEERYDEAAYVAKYSRHLGDPTIHMRSIRVDGNLAGSVAKFVMHGEAEITYWIDKAYWGRGVATAAGQRFLRLEAARPLVGRVAWDNTGSQKVLEQCGFARVGTDRGFAEARQAEIDEYIYKIS